jgi:hypothetical protein
LNGRVELAIRERNDSYNVWRNNVNRVRVDRLLVDYIAKRRHVDALMERKYSRFVSINLDTGLPPRKLNDNLRRRLVSSMVLRGLVATRPSLSILGLSLRCLFLSFPEFSFVCNAVMSIKSNVAGVDEIHLSFVK